MQIYPVLVSPAGMYCLQVSPRPDADIEAGVHGHQSVLAIKAEAAEAEVGVERVGLRVHPLGEAARHSVLSVENKFPHGRVVNHVQLAQKAQSRSNPEAVTGILRLVWPPVQA